MAVDPHDNPSITVEPQIAALQGNLPQGAVPPVPPLPEWAAAYDEGRRLHDKPFRSVCYAPFTTMDFGPTGDVIVCCANNEHIIGNARTQTLNEIWHGEPIQHLRTSFRNYQFAHGCAKCVWQIKSGDVRTTFSKKDDIFPLDTSWTQGPIKMDFRLANTCNLACIMCNGGYSSTIRRDIERLPALDCTYPDRFFDDLAEYMPSLRYAWFTGGEPFLVQNNYRIWDLIIQHGRHVSCRITTNATILNPKVKRYLEQLKLADLCVSIDGATKNTYESIRRGAVFEKVLEHLSYFSDYCKQRGTKLRFAVCALAANWRELPDIHLLAKRYGASVWANVVQPSTHKGPGYGQSISDLSQDEQAEVVEYLVRRYQEIESELDSESKANYQVHLNTIGGPIVVPNVTTGSEGSVW